MFLKNSISVDIVLEYNVRLGFDVFFIYLIRVL